MKYAAMTKAQLVKELEQRDVELRAARLGTEQLRVRVSQAQLPISSDWKERLAAARAEAMSSGRTVRVR